jgi:hypothetical protein
MSILSHFRENLPTTRIVKSTNTLSPGASNVPLDLRSLTLVQEFKIISAPSDFNIRFGGTDQDAIDLQAGDIRGGAFDSLLGSSSAGGAVVIEIHGR